MAGIPSSVYNRLRVVLAQCEPFDSNRRLRSLFAKQELNLWRNGLPEAQSLTERVDAVIDYLHNKHRNDGANGLALLLQALAEQLDPADSRCQALIELASEIRNAPAKPFSPAQSTGTTTASTSPPPSSTKTKVAAKATSTEKKNFFISYTGVDEPWAEWVAWQLETVNYTTIIQAWDFEAGGNFVTDMHRAAMEAERTIAILSEAYFKSGFAQSEWNAAFRQDPTGEKGLLLPVRVQDCRPEGLLGAIVYIDLVGLDETAARDTLLERVQRGRRKPAAPPQFPGLAHKPVFPGD